MTTRAKHEHLLMRYLDGRLTEAETRELSAWLREDAVARAWLRDVAGQVVALGDLAREQRWQSQKPEVAGVELMSARFSRTAWLALAASVVVLGCAVAFWFDGRHGTPSVVVEIEDVTGALNWTGPTGELRTGLTRGQQLSAGMFETASEGAMAQLRFTDGTRVTLGNRTEVALAEDRQKQLRLKAGLLAFEVLPQPPGRPLLVRTPTAMLEVLGTVFTVTAGADQTTLNVEEGRVRLERLTDGEVLDVTWPDRTVSSEHGFRSAGAVAVDFYAATRGQLERGLAAGQRCGAGLRAGRAVRRGSARGRNASLSAWHYRARQRRSSRHPGAGQRLAAPLAHRAAGFAAGNAGSSEGGWKIRRELRGPHPQRDDPAGKRRLARGSHFIG